MEQLKILRLSHKLTQQEIANILGVDRTTYVKYETGKSEPTFETLVRLADYFGVSTDYLLGNEKTPSGNVYDQYSEEDLEIAKLYAALPDDDRRALKDYLEYLADKNKKQN